MTAPQAQPTGPVANEQTLAEGRPAVLDSVGRWFFAIITLGVAALVWWIQSLSNRYRITDQRLVLKTGLLTVRTDYIELYRVTDLLVEEPLSERMLGYGRLVVVSSDRTDPKAVLRGIKDPDKLADQLRGCIENQKRTRRVATITEA
jgi:uncharacterized membrane protein YdbT with pleckstrin-like domain